MQSSFTRGGRNKSAPYATTHARIPENLKGYVSRISDGYKLAIENDTINEYTRRLQISLETIFDDKPVNENDTVELAKKIVELRRQKKSTKAVLDNLLTAILGENDEHNR